MDNFAVFILTHGRPGAVLTYGSLLRSGYTGPIYIIIDNEDEAADEYRDRFGDKVIVFDKAAIAQHVDTADNSEDRRAVLFARHACWQIARDLNISYFVQLDDDYTGFIWKYDKQLRYKERPILHSLDELFAVILRFYKAINASVIALAQNGDFIGGAHGYNARRIWLKRKAMNSFFCDARRAVNFVGRMNEDVSAYVLDGLRGQLFFTVFNASLFHKQTQSLAGGMTEMYRAEGTYRKSFYTVMCAPSCVKVGVMGASKKRLHHHIMWANATPYILDEAWRVDRVDA